MKLFNIKKEIAFIEKDININIDGLGIVMYSPKTVSYIKEGTDFLNDEFIKPEDVSKHVMDCDITGFCTGSPGNYILKIRYGYPSEEIESEYNIITRLGLKVKDNKVNFVDLYFLSGWNKEVNNEQIINVNNGFYHITCLTKKPESGKYGDNQVIYIYFNKLNSKPKLKYKGVPILYK